MIRKEVRFQEKDESEYGWEYVKPYIENNPHKPLHYVLEQIFREHELYKGIADNIVTIQNSMNKRLDKMEKEVHYSLLRTGDAEKNVRTLLHCWNSYFFISNASESNYFGLSECVTPIMQKAIDETNAYYKELALKKRSKAEMTLPKIEEPVKETKIAHQNNEEAEQPVAQPKTQQTENDEFDVSSMFTD